MNEEELKTFWVCSVCKFSNCTAKGNFKPDSCVYSEYKNVAIWQELEEEEEE